MSEKKRAAPAWWFARQRELKNNPWVRIHDRVLRVKKGEDIAECEEHTGLTSGQLRTWFQTLADGHEYFVIDHIKPRLLCDDEHDDEKLKQFFHYSNLQPLTKGMNFSKLSRFTEEDEEAWQRRTNDIKKCETFEEALDVVRGKGVNFGDALWPWRLDPAAPKQPYTNVVPSIVFKKRVKTG